MSVEDTSELVAAPPDGWALLLETYVAGVRYYDFADAGEPLDAGARVELRREPDNPHDRRAIAVDHPDGRMLGYLPRRRNTLPCRLMDAGYELRARVESVEGVDAASDSSSGRCSAPNLRVAVFVAEDGNDSTASSRSRTVAATDGGEPMEAAETSTGACESDWKTEPLPDERRVIELDRRFDAEEMESIREGFIPTVMEEKWFLYWSEGRLYMHRSWTGICVYVVEFEACGEGARAVRALVNDDPDQFKGSSADYERFTIYELIENLLLSGGL
ncbi:MAG: HIRAN domain-containing protein [Bradymonadaceae bacterium]